MDGKKIGEKLRSLRESKGQSKRFLARKLGCSYSAVCSWEYGDRIPSDEMKKKLAEHFGVSVDIFFAD